LEPAPRDVVTAKGHVLAARVFAPAGEPRGGVLIVPAMGAAQSYYGPFAAWLAAQGFVTATFDYRGIGGSRRGPLRDVDADIIDWGASDCGAMLDALALWAPGRPLYWIGHSLGGQILPFVPNGQRLTRAVTIATGSGYWRENSPGLRWRAWWLWYVVAPLATALCGYFPGKRLRKVGDLPKGVINQWRRWCLNPEYAVGAEGSEVRARYASVTVPLVSLSFTDDEFMSGENTASLHGFYTSAPLLAKRFRPADLGVRRIGHFGFFRPAFEQSLWRAHLLPALD
jgi:predicted alpha/beta hydrolase